MVVIAISGKPGSGSSTAGKLLAEKLGLRFFSIGKYHKSFGTGKSETERSMNTWEKKKPELKRFEHEKDDLARKLASEGNVVIEAKLAIHMIKNADFKIWLFASDKIRASRYAERDRTDLKTALKKLKEKEEKERRIWKDIYGFDYFEQEKDADIVIDTGNKTPDEIVELIISKIKKK